MADIMMDIAESALCNIMFFSEGDNIRNRIVMTAPVVGKSE